MTLELQKFQNNSPHNLREPLYADPSVLKLLAAALGPISIAPEIFINNQPQSHNMPLANQRGSLEMTDFQEGSGLLIQVSSDNGATSVPLGTNYGYDDEEIILEGEPVYSIDDDIYDDNNYVDEDDEARGRTKGKCTRFLFALFLKTLFFLAIQVFVMLTMRFEFGNELRGPSGWFLCCEGGLLAAYIVTEGICTPFCFTIWKSVKRKRKERKWKDTVILLFIIHCFNIPFFQVVLSIFVPNESFLLPLETFSTEISSKVSNSCYSRRFDAAETFYTLALNNQRVPSEQNLYLIDFSSVTVVHGGMPKWTKNAGGMVIDQTIHVDECCCPSTSLLVHELFHVWQVQSGVLFKDGSFGFWEWLWKQIVDRSGSYNYGGEEGLWSALEGNTPFIDFGIEQQAEMMQDSYHKWKNSPCVQDLDLNERDLNLSPYTVCPIPSPYLEMVTQVLDYYGDFSD